MRFAKGAADRVDCAELRASCDEDQVSPQHHVPTLDRPNWNWVAQLEVAGQDGTSTYEDTNELYIQARASEVAALQLKLECQGFWNWSADDIICNYNMMYNCGGSNTSAICAGLEAMGSDLDDIEMRLVEERRWVQAATCARST